MALTPVAVSEGKGAASNMLENTTVAPDHDGVPTAALAIPELGLTTRQLKSMTAAHPTVSADLGSML